MHRNFDRNFIGKWSLWKRKIEPKHYSVVQNHTFGLFEKNRKIDAKLTPQSCHFGYKIDLWAATGTEMEPKGSKSRPKSSHKSVFGLFSAIFSAKSRPGRPKGRTPRSVYLAFGVLLGEKVAPRVDCRRRATADTFGCWLVKRGKEKRRN